MNNVRLAGVVEPSVGIAGQPVSTRIVSIDVFRGLTMAMMIFVNDLSDVHGLSKWTYHMPANVDAMTYVDMVFPAFLFLVGMSLPLAVRQRLRRDTSLPKLWLHVLLRVVGLVALGLVLANAELGDSARMHLNTNVWALLALVGAVLLWMVYERGVSRRTVLLSRGMGAMLLVGMYAIFRRQLPHGGEGWINFSYPEILGLIGLTYLGVCLLYIPLRRWMWMPLAGFAAMLVLNIACSAKWISISLPMYVWPWDNGAMAMITFGGMVVSMIFLGDHRWPKPRQKMGIAIGFALLALLLGLALRPLGISKIRATPTWGLWSVGASTLIFTALYWICDVRRWTAWAALLRPAGANTLLTYLLPDFFVYLTSWLGLGYVLGHWNAGPAGVLRSIGFTIVILFVAAGLTRAKLRLQL